VEKHKTFGDLMKQYELIENLRDIIIEDGLVDAIFLTGDFASDIFDESSIVFFNIIVSKDNYNAFYERSLKYISSYSSILYYNLDDQNELSCVYENGVILKLIIKVDLSKNDEELLIIFDKYKLLSNNIDIDNQEDFSYSPSKIAEELSVFCLYSLDFYRFFERGEYLNALLKSMKLFESYTKIIRFRFDDKNAKLGLIDFYKTGVSNIPEEELKKFFVIANKLKLDSNLESVKRMFISIDTVVNNFPIKIAEYINFDFYLFSKKLIMSTT
jgi:hypothetical protein